MAMQSQETTWEAKTITIIGCIQSNDVRIADKMADMLLGGSCHRFANS